MIACYHDEISKKFLSAWEGGRGRGAQEPGWSDESLLKPEIEISSNLSNYIFKVSTVEPLLRGHPDERPPPLERPLANINLNINVLISTPDKRPPLFSDAKGVASQEGFHCIKGILNYFETFHKEINLRSLCYPIQSKWIRSYVYNFAIQLFFVNGSLTIF